MDTPDTGNKFMLQFKGKISLKQSDNLIYDMYHHGDGIQHLMRIDERVSVEDIKNFIVAQGDNLKEVIENVRTGGKVPYIEVMSFGGNAICTGFESIGVSDPSIKGSDVHHKLKGDGVVSMLDYIQKFESSNRYKLRAIENLDLEDVYSSVIKLFASIESFFNYKALQHNVNCSEGEALIDSKTTPVDLVGKFKRWVPVLSNGQRADLSGKEWRAFIRLQKIRNDEAIHPKNASQAVSLSDIAVIFNDIREVSKLFFSLHKLMGMRVSTSIIRASYQPDVELTTTEA